MAITHKLIAIAAGVVVFGAVSASAATLGGVATDDLGANSNTVKAQVTGGVKVGFTTAYDTTLGGYKVSAITLAPVTGTIPVTANVKVTLKGAAGASLGEYSSSDGGATWTPPVGTVSARSVIGASVVINGGTTTAAVTGTD